MGSSFKPV
jgi:ribosome assembly protein 1